MAGRKSLLDGDDRSIVLTQHDIARSNYCDPLTESTDTALTFASSSSASDLDNSLRGGEGAGCSSPLETNNGHNDDYFVLCKIDNLATHDTRECHRGAARPREGPPADHDDDEVENYGSFPFEGRADSPPFEDVSDWQVNAQVPTAGAEHPSSGAEKGEACCPPPTTHPMQQYYYYRGGKSSPVRLRGGAGSPCNTLDDNIRASAEEKKSPYSPTQHPLEPYYNGLNALFPLATHVMQQYHNNQVEVGATTPPARDDSPLLLLAHAYRNKTMDTTCHAEGENYGSFRFDGGAEDSPPFQDIVGDWQANNAQVPTAPRHIYGKRVSLIDEVREMARDCDHRNGSESNGGNIMVSEGDPPPDVEFDRFHSSERSEQHANLHSPHASEKGELAHLQSLNESERIEFAQLQSLNVSERSEFIAEPHSLKASERSLPSLNASERNELAQFYSLEALERREFAEQLHSLNASERSEFAEQLHSLNASERSLHSLNASERSEVAELHSLNASERSLHSLNASERSEVAELHSLNASERSSQLPLSRTISPQDWERMSSLLNVYSSHTQDNENGRCEPDIHARPQSCTNQAQNVTGNPMQRVVTRDTATATPVVPEDWGRISDILSNGCDIATPLSQWIELEGKRSITSPKASILRKLNVAFGIGKLLQRSCGAHANFSIHNFAVQESSDELSTGNDAGWEVTGVSMFKPLLTIELASTSFLSANFTEAHPSEDNEDIEGRDVTANIVGDCFSGSDKMNIGLQDETLICRSFGELLHFIFSQESAIQVEHDNGYDSESKECNHPLDDAFAQEPRAKKQSLLPQNTSFSRALSISGLNGDVETDSKPSHDQQRLSLEFRPLIEYGCPPSLSQLVGDLLSSGDSIFQSDNSFKCLEDAISDIHLLLGDKRLLFMSSHKTHEGRHVLVIPKDRLYGRSNDASLITDAFRRVVSTRRSEVVLVRGYSGSGKTRLVKSTLEEVRFTGGYIVRRKFEQTSTQGCLAVVLSAFDEISVQIAKTKSAEQIYTIYQSLRNEFGASLDMLLRILPNINVLNSYGPACSSSHEVDSQINMLSLCYALQRFMKVLTRCSVSGMLFLDDIQWCDPLSLGLVQAVLSDHDNQNSVLFVGTYRDDLESNIQHIQGFLNLLQCIVPCNTVNLGGMSKDDVNSMISDSLRLVPRLCIELSSVVHRKTGGNPFFIQTFLHTLVDRGLLTYKLRERRWVWDLDKIGAEQITDNVLYLISLKMTLLHEDVVTALKIASCFGIKVQNFIVECLSASPRYSALQYAMDKAVQEGFMDRDQDHYCFVHDKVREGAYDMIGACDRDKLHFDIGMSLYSSCINRVNLDEDKILFTIIEQMNHGVPLLVTSACQQSSVAKLNFQAGLSAMNRYNFMDALTYLKVAASILPAYSWQSLYELSLKTHMELAKAAYSNGAIDIAKKSLAEIEQNGRTLEDKLDAYDLLIDIHLQGSVNEQKAAISLCCKALTQLGEDVSRNPEARFSIFKYLPTITKTRAKCALTSESSLLSMPRRESKKSLTIMRFYCQLALASYIEDRILCGYYISVWVNYCLNKKEVCRYTPSALTFYSAALVYGFEHWNCVEAHRIGKIALTLLNESKYKMQLPRAYLGYYGYTGVMFEPLQACEEQHRKAYEIGMQVGNANDALLNVAFMIPRMLEGGKNLRLIENEIKYYKKLAKQYKHKVLALCMCWYQDTVDLLCNDGSKSDVPLTSHESAIPVHLVQLIMPTFYLRRVARVVYLAKKWDSLDDNRRNFVPSRIVVVAFFSGLASAETSRRKNLKRLHKDIIRSIDILAKAARMSEWNCRGKHSLLLAEKASLEGKNENAEMYYDASIREAHSSRFVHEEGLACELAASHHEAKGNKVKAKELFLRAKQCYEDWGSPIKTLQISDHLDALER